MLSVNYEIVVSGVCLMLSFSIIYPVLSLWLCRETLSRTLNYLCITANCVYIFFAAQNIREICLNCNNSSENKLNNCAAVKTSKFLGLNCFLLSWNALNFSINIACLCESLSLYIHVYVCVCLCVCLCICFVCVCHWQPVQTWPRWNLVSYCRNHIYLKLL